MTSKICASLSGFTGKEDLSKADMVEIRLDLLGDVPAIDGKELLVTFRDGVDLSVLPEGFEGMIDIGTEPRPDTTLTVVSSYHDYDATPSSDEIVSLLASMPGDIRKGAFRTDGFGDLHNLFRASEAVGGRSVLLGMGEFGTVTRVRSTLLRNEFTFAYVDAPTAPGQIGLEEMAALGDDCLVLGIVGDPLSRSMSPEMHRAAMRSEGLNGIYLRFETDDLEHCADVVREYNIRGLNITIPHKEAMLHRLDRLDETAEAVGAVNTLVNDDGVLTGYNTDVAGIDTALAVNRFEPWGKRAVIMGSGGAARACAYALTARGCAVTVTGRNEAAAARLAADLGCEYKPAVSIPVMLYDLIVNCTPIGMYGDGSYPLDLSHINRHQTVFDMVYGAETPIVSAARAATAGVITGSDMLAGQGAASFGLWTGHHDTFDKMRSVLP